MSRSVTPIMAILFTSVFGVIAPIQADVAERATINDQLVADLVVLAQSYGRLGNRQVDGGLGGGSSMNGLNTDDGTKVFNRRGLGTFSTNRLGRMSGHGLGTMTGSGLGVMTGSGLGTMSGGGVGGLAGPGSSLRNPVPRRSGNQP